MHTFKIYTGGSEVIAQCIINKLVANGYIDKAPGQNLELPWIILDTSFVIWMGAGYISFDSIPELTLYDIFHNNKKWKRPIKEMTITEISQKLGYPIKIVE